jgi:hypothetical protein
VSNDNLATTRLTELLNDLESKAVELSKTDLPNAEKFLEFIGYTTHHITETLKTLGIVIVLDEPENTWQPEEVADEPWGLDASKGYSIYGQETGLRDTDFI